MSDSLLHKRSAVDSQSANRLHRVRPVLLCVAKATKRLPNKTELIISI